MKIGPAVRTRLGRLETPAAELYRKVFFDVDHFAELALVLAPTATRILEIGCGDGAVADRLTAIYPRADYLGIDVAPSPGRRYQGDPTRATFRSIYSGELLAEDPAAFDLICVVDVLHHVPGTDARRGLLADAAAMLAPGGMMLVKEWEKIPGLGYNLGWVADRYVAGDTQVQYMPRAELLEHLGKAAPELEVRHSVSVRPWRCNVVHALRAA